MKAVVIKDTKTVKELEVAKPKIQPNEVLIKTHYIGLCGSDLSAYRGLMPMVEFPRIPGHEISGEIAEVGEQVPATYQIGYKVTVSPYTNCGVCPACKIGRVNTCEFNQTLGVQRDGALTEYITVPHEKVFVSEVLNFKELALVEPLSVGYHAANRARICETDMVVLFGCGTIGMGALLAACRKGATVIAVDIDDIKLEMAKKFGAVFTINSAKEDTMERIVSITKNKGVDVAIEAAGIPATFAMALEVVCFAGRIVTIGYSKTDVTINTQLIVRKELDVLGSRNALHVFPSVIQMLENRDKPYTDFITKIYAVTEAGEALNYWDKNAGAVMKILIEVGN